MKIKYAYDNVGDMVLTDGNIFVGFSEPQVHTIANLNSYISFSKSSIRKLGIDNITDWKEYIGEE